MNHASGRCWWLTVENVHDHEDGARAISLPEIAPFLDGREPCFRWPPQGKDRAHYHQMETGDTAVIWTGHNPEGYPGWGVLGFAQIYVRDIGLEYPEILLTRDWFPDDMLVPFPAGTTVNRQARTPESDFLWEVLGADFEPLVELFSQLRYMDGRPAPKTVYPVGFDTYMALRHRMLMQAA